MTTWKQIEKSREIRLWVTQIVVPGVTLGGTLMELIEKEVLFSDYCNRCKHKDKAGDEEPCDECLSNPCNINSHKPVCFKEKK